ncbi:tetratricopeptide repeat protein [Nostoc sp. FACHB-110]|uniref:tetratricopeptide repeat protein n=1 Tax=Nostoc sp. FACHB-110 TaxID=2692834 RepID=UPI00168A297C|nr:tetratricopeptide repeat protein [Nostoc sp. FACHB-110]MBD2436253.1 tetratricopeptide repeat protein [Nostoc sp. FACHB-110]
MTSPVPYYISRKQAQDFLAKFTKALESPESNPLLFQIYGFGGVGKTTLTKKLKEMHEPQADFAEVSFGLTPGIETPLKLMVKLYEQLPKRTGLLRTDILSKPDPFTSVYEQYEETFYKLKTEPVQGKSVDTEQQNTVKDWLELGTGMLLATGAAHLGDPATALSLGLDAVVKAGGMLSDTPQAIKSSKERMQELLQKHPATKNNKELQELMLEPIPKLTHAFAQGLIQKAHKHKPSIVLILDTYEKAPSDIDTWLWQYLLEDTTLKSNPVRIVVAGRRSLLEKESWRKLQQDRDLIYEQRLDEFSKEQTKEYLQHIGITKSGEIQKIYNATKGLPYYLNWIKREKETNRDIDFSRGNQAITNLLLQGLSTHQKQIVQLAACCRGFDRSLIEYLMQKKGIDFETGACATSNCFDWLTKCDFVEFVQGRYRLDDVARDIFRLSFCQDDKTRFRETHELLAKYFEQRANQEVTSDSPEPQKYENADWRQCTAEFIYHALFARRDEGQREFIYHLFASRYMKQFEVVMIPFAAVVTELAVENYRLLPDSTEKFLKSIKLGFLFSWVMLANEPAKYDIDYQDGTGPSKEEIEAAIRPCFTQVDFLKDGLGKYAGLVYTALRSHPNQRKDLLLQAIEQAEFIYTNTHPEFSSRLFLDISDHLYKLGEYEEALAIQEKALAIQDDFSETWSNRGALLISLKRYEDAIISCDRALVIKDDFPEAWFNRGYALINLERYNEALASYDKGLAIKDDFFRAWLDRGYALINLERYNEALASYDRALERKDNYSEAWFYQGDLLNDLKRYDEALSSYNKALNITPNEPTYLNSKSLTLSFLGRYEEALANINEAKKILLEEPLLWTNQGIILARAGRYQEAMASCEKALQLKPDDESGYYGKACCYALQGNIELAIENLQKAININSSRCRREAKRNPDFDSIREDARFQALLQA